MGMSLWRMYSAREQDQPPSVLLVGTFYENQQETERWVTDCCLIFHLKSVRPFQPLKGRPSQPTPKHTNTHPRARVLSPETTKFYIIPLRAPLLGTEPTGSKWLHSFPIHFPSTFPEQRDLSTCFHGLFHSNDERNQIKNSDSLRRGLSCYKLAAVSQTHSGQQSLSQ